MENKKGKRNKLKIGQRVRATPELIDWHSSHLTWSYGKHVKDPSYGNNKKEISVEDLGSIYIWIKAKLSNIMPVGVVEGYGSRDNEGKVDRKNVYVKFTTKTDFGIFTENNYVEEKNLELVKEKTKSRKR